MSGNVMTLGDFQNAVHDLSNVWVINGREAGRHPNRLPDMFTMGSSNKAVEVHTVYNGMDLMTPVEDGGIAPPDAFQQQHTKFYEHQEYKKSFVVTRKMLDDGKAFPVQEEGSMMLGESYVESQNITGYSAVNNGFTSELAADGVAIFSASHTSTSGTTSNLLSTSAAISEAALEQFNIEIKKFKDDRGLKANLRPNKVHVPVELDAEACRLLDNPNRPGTADRDINYVNNKGIFPGGYMDNVYLSDTAAYFVSTNEARNCMMFYNRINLEVKSTVDDETENMITRAYARWGYGCTKWLGLFASAGT